MADCITRRFWLHWFGVVLALVLCCTGAWADDEYYNEDGHFTFAPPLTGIIWKMRSWISFTGT